MHTWEIVLIIYESAPRKIFCQCYQKYIRHHPSQRGVYTPTHKSRRVFSDILATAIMVNTLYGLETWYVKSFRHIGIIQNVFWHLTLTSSMSDVFVILQFLVTSSVIEFVETFDFYIHARVRSGDRILSVESDILL